MIKLTSKEAGDVMEWHYLNFVDENGKEIEVSVEINHSSNPDYDSVDEINILTECSEENEKLINDYVNSLEWIY